MSQTKRPYQRPHIEAIPLQSEEVVLAACKTAMGGAMGKNGSNCTKPTACVAIGS